MSMPSDPTLYERQAERRPHRRLHSPSRRGWREAGLEILPAGERRPALVWPYAELQTNVPLRADARDVLLSTKPGGAQTLFVADPAFSEATVCSGAALSAGRQRLRGLRPGLAVVALVVAIAVAVRLLELHPAQTIASLLPQKTREAMGRNVIAQVTGKHAAMRERGGPRRARPAHPATDGCRVGDTDAGACGGDRLGPRQRLRGTGRADHPHARPLQTANSPDEVAGVLSHELGSHPGAAS